MELYGLPLNSKGVVTLDVIESLGIVPPQQPTAIDCCGQVVAIGYSNGDIAVYKLNRIPGKPVLVHHKYAHDSIVSDIHIPQYLSHQLPYVITSGINGRVIYHDMSLMGPHGGVVVSQTGPIQSFAYSPFIDGILFSDLDDTIKLVTAFSRSESRKVITCRGGASLFASSTRHPFVALAGASNGLVLFNANHARVKRGKYYPITHSLFTDTHHYIMDSSKLSSTPPSMIRVDASLTCCIGKGSLTGLSWYRNDLLVVANQTLFRLSCD